MPLWMVTNTHAHVGTVAGLSGREWHREVVGGRGGEGEGEEVVEEGGGR